MVALSVRSRVAAVLEAIGPRAICDDCLCEMLELPARAQANKATRYLQGEHGFLRIENECARCGKKRLVISRRRDTVTSVCEERGRSP